MTETTSKRRSIGGLILKGLGVVFIVMIALTILGAIVGGDEAKPAGEEASASAPSSSVVPNQPAQEDEPENKLTAAQQNAARSASSYLEMTGFSRAGLISQLSSSAGDGYSREDATAAVDSLNVDWNAQAVRSAEQYLSMMGFSCNRLIDQLSSDSGSKYTRSEARHGAEQAGAC